MKYRCLLWMVWLCLTCIRANILHTNSSICDVTHSLYCQMYQLQKSKIHDSYSGILHHAFGTELTQHYQLKVSRATTHFLFLTVFIFSKLSKNFFFAQISFKCWKNKISVPNNVLTNVTNVFTDLENAFVATRYLSTSSKYWQFNKQGHRKQELEKLNPSIWVCAITLNTLWNYVNTATPRASLKG
jgi:hypothetical protein